MRCSVSRSRSGPSGPEASETTVIMAEQVLLRWLLPQHDRRRAVLLSNVELAVLSNVSGSWRAACQTDAPLWKDRKSSSCLEKITRSSKARSAALASATAAAEDQRTDSRPAQEETQRVESKKRARIQRSQGWYKRQKRGARRSAALVARRNPRDPPSTIRNPAGRIKEAASAGASAASLCSSLAITVSSKSSQVPSSNVAKRSRPSGASFKDAKLKEPVVSCASEIRIADASTSVESGAITACAHGYRVPFAKAVSTSGATYVVRRTLLSQLLMQVPLSRARRSLRGTRLITTFCIGSIESRISKTVDSRRRPSRSSRRRPNARRGRAVEDRAKGRVVGP